MSNDSSGWPADPVTTAEVATWMYRAAHLAAGQDGSGGGPDRDFRDVKAVYVVGVWNNLTAQFQVHTADGGVFAVQVIRVEG